MKSQKGIIHIILVIALLIVGLGALVFVMYKTNSLPVVTTSSPNPSPTSKNIMLEDINFWKKYTNTKNGYEVSYPSNADITDDDLDAVTINYCGKWDFEACHESSFVPQNFKIQVSNFNGESFVPECLLDSKKVDTIKEINWTTYEGELTGDCTDQGFGGFFYRRSFTQLNDKYIEISYDYRNDDEKNALEKIFSTFKIVFVLNTIGSNDIQYTGYPDFANPWYKSYSFVFTKNWQLDTKDRSLTYKTSRGDSVKLIFNAYGHGLPDVKQIADEKKFYPAGELSYSLWEYTDNKKIGGVFRFIENTWAIELGSLAPESKDEVLKDIDTLLNSVKFNK